VKTTDTPFEVMHEVRSLIEEAARSFDLDMDIQTKAVGRDATDDLMAWHHRQLALCSVLRWQVTEIAKEFHLHSNCVRVTPRLFGRLAATRIMVITLGEQFPASRMHADRLLGQANDRLNYLSVMLEATDVF